MIQVNTSGEASKSGCEPSACAGLVRAVAATCPALSVRGLMTIGEYEAAPSRRFFDTLSACRAETAALLRADRAAAGTRGAEKDAQEEGAQEEDAQEVELELSMGMSHDMELAIASGSTEVRVGTAIFGARGAPFVADPESDGDE